MKLHFPQALCLTLALLCSMSTTGFAAEQAIAQAESRFTAEGDIPATCSASTLGSLAADAVQATCETEFSIITGGSIAGTLEAKSIFESDIERVVPEDTEILITDVTPAQLKALLETGVSHLETDESEAIDVEASAWEGFPQVSGFNWTYDVSAPVGQRVLYINVDGTELDLTDTTTSYTIAVDAAMFDVNSGYDLAEGTACGMTLRQALITYCRDTGTLKAPANRATVLGSSSYTLLDQMPILVIVICVVLICVLSVIPKWKEKKYFSFEHGLRDDKEKYENL